VIHENCPRRAHFDAGRFAWAFGDEGHRKGWCLYKLGCKGPVTHAACATHHFNEVPGTWPIGTGVQQRTLIADALKLRAAPCSPEIRYSALDEIRLV